MANVSLHDFLAETKITEQEQMSHELRQMFNELRRMIQNCYETMQRIESYLTVDKEMNRRDAFVDGVNYAVDVAKRIKG